MKISIAGEALVLTTEKITVEQLKTLKSGNPAALKIFDEKGENELYAISYNEGNSNVSKFSITFGGATRDGKNLATLTLPLPKGLTTKEAAAAYAADLVGSVGASYMAKLEESVPAAAKELTDARDALIKSVTVS